MDTWRRKSTSNNQLVTLLKGMRIKCLSWRMLNLGSNKHLEPEMVIFTATYVVMGSSNVLMNLHICEGEEGRHVDCVPVCR